MPLRAKGRRVAVITRAIDLVRGVDHRSDVSERDAPLVEVVVNVVGDHLPRPTPTQVVADQMRLTNECFFGVGRPREADCAQLCEVRVVLGSGGSRNRGAANQGSAGHHGDGKSGRPAN